MRLLKRCTGHAEAQKRFRCQLIRDGSSHNEWKTILVEKARGQHKEAIHKSVDISLKLSVLGEVIIDEMENELEQEINSLPDAVRSKFQQKLHEICAVGAEQEKPVVDAPVSERGPTKGDYIDSLFEE